jgi:hypothetical protein
VDRGEDGGLGSGAEMRLGDARAGVGILVVTRNSLPTPLPDFATLRFPSSFALASFGGRVGGIRRHFRARNPKTRGAHGTYVLRASDISRTIRSSVSIDEKESSAPFILESVSLRMEKHLLI